MLRYCNMLAILVGRESLPSRHWGDILFPFVLLLLLLGILMAPIAFILSITRRRWRQSIALLTVILFFLLGLQGMPYVLGMLMLHADLPINLSNLPQPFLYEGMVLPVVMIAAITSICLCIWVFNSKRTTRLKEPNKDLDRTSG